MVYKPIITPSNDVQTAFRLYCKQEEARCDALRVALRMGSTDKIASLFQAAADNHTELNQMAFILARRVMMILVLGALYMPSCNTQQSLQQCGPNVNWLLLLTVFFFCITFSLYQLGINLLLKYQMTMI